LPRHDVALMTVWRNPVDAKRKYRLSDKHIQMARELGMNPKKFGSLANHKQEKWKALLPEFIEELYIKRFRKERPDVIG
jgi:hypothetical protein